MPEPAQRLDRDNLERAFQRLGEIAAREGRLIEISVYGGSALVLTMNFRQATRDVDAVFEADRDFVRRAAAIVAGEFGWNDDWINDGVKGFLSEADANSKTLFRSYPAETGPGLRVMIAAPEYLFAMKCLAMRATGAERSADVDDIRHLAALIGVRTADEAIGIVSRYYPAGQIRPKTRFGIEEIFGGPVAE
jgi:hypothetical protein